MKNIPSGVSVLQGYMSRAGQSTAIPSRVNSGRTSFLVSVWHLHNVLGEIHTRANLELRPLHPSKFVHPLWDFPRHPSTTTTITTTTTSCLLTPRSHRHTSLLPATSFSSVTRKSPSCPVRCSGREARVVRDNEPTLVSSDLSHVTLSPGWSDLKFCVCPQMERSRRIEIHKHYNYL